MRTRTLLACALLVTALMVGVNFAATACPPPQPSCKVKLWAGQTTLSAYITITLESDGDVSFYFDTQDGWKVYELHIQIEDSLDDMPTNKKGNLVPGKFEWKKEFSSGAEDFTVTVDDEFVPDDGDFYVIVHAVVKKGDAEETGWANKCEDMDYFNPDGPGWATYVYFD